MNRLKPIVSIIIATYNRAQFIGATLDSILNQTYFDYEVIIVDDGGTDNTLEVLKNYLNDPRFKFFMRPAAFSKGCPGSRNYGLTKITGQFIWFFDDDDIAHPKLLEKCIYELINTDHDFCRFERTVFYNSEKIQFEENAKPRINIITKKNLKQIINGELPFNSCQVVWRKSSIGTAHFRGDIIYADDWEFYSRLISIGLKGVSLDEKLLFARKHPGTATHRYKTGNKKIIDSVILANLSVIDIAIEEKIFDEQLFKFFYRQALSFKSYPIVKYLVEKSNLNILKSLKYKLGFYTYPALRPIFRIKSELKKT